jgi:uncharacterized lipoprotein YmbA
MRLSSVIMLCSLLPLTACFSTKPVRDKVRFYLIAPSAGSVEMVQNAPSIGVREVEMPGYLSSSKIVVRKTDAELVYSTFELWSEPLRDSATHTLATRLAARIGREHVDVFPWTNGVARDTELRVQFDRFEGTADGRVLASGRYILSPAGGKPGTVIVVAFDYQGKWDRKDYTSLARVLGDELDRLAAEILAQVAAK